MTLAQESSSLLSAMVEPRVSNSGPEHYSLATLQRDQKTRAEWDRAIETCLVECLDEWHGAAAAQADDGFVPPSSSVWEVAAQLGQDMRDAGMPPPLRMVPDGEGGICFERGDKSSFEMLSVLADGTVRLQGFQNCRLVLDRVLSRP